ncbi:MAG: metallophosphoesterase [Capnocytophaga sp.]|nr:metallophosphoesterase [Capnocytophaga sp.]
MNRRQFIKKSLLATTAIGVSSGLYAWQVEPFRLEFTNVDMPIKNLPTALDGKTMMQISDLHVGNRFDYQYLIDSLQKANQYNPDIVVYTGDYVSYENERQFAQLDEVLTYFVKGKLGTFAVLGNHDYGHHWRETAVADHISKQLERSGINVLRNQITECNNLKIIGLDDYWAVNFNPETAMKYYDRQKPAVVLCHNPDVCDLPVWNGYQGWILSGHTHGGQCKPPFLPAPILPVKNKRYSQGIIDLHDGRTLYINRALGHSWQIRFNVRPEITIFTMKSV